MDENRRRRLRGLERKNEVFNGAGKKSSADLHPAIYPVQHTDNLGSSLLVSMLRCCLDLI